MDKAALKRFLGTPEGDALKAFIFAHIRGMDTLDGITATEPHQVAVQVEARKVARETLKTMFSDLGILDEAASQSDTENEFAV